MLSAPPRPAPGARVSIHASRMARSGSPNARTSGTQWLLAATLSVAATAAPAPTAVPPPLEALQRAATTPAGGNYSAECLADRHALQSDNKVYKAVMPVISTSTAIVIDLIDRCTSNATKCTTPYGPGSCCEADGTAAWQTHKDKVDAFRAAARADVRGGLVWLVEQAVVGSDAALLESTYKHTLPFFIPTRCEGEADMAVLLEALSHDCAADPARGPIRLCKYYRAPSGGVAR